MSDVPLSELHQAVLDAPVLAALFADLAACAEVLEVRAKGAATAYGNDAAGLDQVQAALSAGTLHGAQIRYAWQGALWCDTLLRADGGVRIVRTRIPS